MNACGKDPVAYSLGAALLACGLCSAMPPSRRWVRADKVDSSRAQPGMTVQVRLDGVPATDSLRRNAHVRGIYFRAIAQCATEDNNVAVSAHLARSIWQNVYLEDMTGHQYFPSLDGRDLLDDHFFRMWRYVQWEYLGTGPQATPFALRTTDNGIPADVTPPETDLAVDVGLYMPLTDLRPWRSPLMGLIPLAALQRNSSYALRFRIGTAFAGSPTGITINGLLIPAPVAGATALVEGMEVWLDLVYIDGWVIDAPWQTDNYTLSDTSGVLRHADRLTEYAAIRYHEDDAAALAGFYYAANHNYFTLRAAGFNDTGGSTIDEMHFRQCMFAASEIDSATQRSNAAQELPFVDGTGLTAVLLWPERPRDGAQAGPLQYEYGERTTATFTRYAHRTVGCHDKRRAEILERELKFDHCRCVNGYRPGESVGKYDPVIINPTTHRVP